MSNGLDVITLFEKISGFKYALCKVDVPYMPKDFPKNVPAGKDIDILCTKDNFEDICKIITEYSEGFKDVFEIRVLDSSSNFRIRLENQGKLYLQFDLSCSLESIDEKWLEEAIGRSVADRQYRQLALADELVVRLFEYRKNRSKSHHKRFVRKHLNSIDIDMVAQNNLEKIHKEIVNMGAKEMIKDILRPYWHRIRPKLRAIKRKIIGSGFKYPELDDYFIMQDTNKFLAKQMRGGI